MHQAHLHEIFATSSSVEAAIHIGRDGLPLAWRSRSDASIEAISSAAANLFTFGFELGLVPEDKSAQLAIDANHGIMLVRTLADGTFLCVLTTQGCSLQEMESILDTYEVNQQSTMEDG